MTCRRHTVRPIRIDRPAVGPSATSVVSLISTSLAAPRTNRSPEHRLAGVFRNDALSIGKEATNADQADQADPGARAGATKA